MGECADIYMAIGRQISAIRQQKKSDSASTRGLDRISIKVSVKWHEMRKRSAKQISHFYLSHPPDSNMVYRNPTPTVDMMIELIDHPARAIVPSESHFHPNRNKF